MYLVTSLSTRCVIPITCCDTPSTTKWCYWQTQLTQSDTKWCHYLSRQSLEISNWHGRIFKWLWVWPEIGNLGSCLQLLTASVFAPLFQNTLLVEIPTSSSLVSQAVIPSSKMGCQWSLKLFHCLHSSTSELHLHAWGIYRVECLVSTAALFYVPLAIIPSFWFGLSCHLQEIPIFQAWKICCGCITNPAHSHY